MLPLPTLMLPVPLIPWHFCSPEHPLQVCPSGKILPSWDGYVNDLTSYHFRFFPAINGVTGHNTLNPSKDILIP